MRKVTLADAIRHLVPDSQFSYDEEDLDTLIWDGPEGKQPSKKEILDTLKVVEKLKKDEAKAKAEARAAILDRLGLTAEEAAILLG